MPKKTPAWDVFISHAGEDKDSLVRPLATELSRLGLRVWYDEFSLRIGDSISATIDKGLAEASFGLVILSPSFIAKPWPLRELAGLVAGEMGRDQVILPVWYHVSKAEILSFSPPLADKLAIVATETPLPDLAMRIVERVKPELHRAFLRRLAYIRELDEGRKKATHIEVPPETLRTDGPIRYETFPDEFMNRLRLIHETFREILSVSWEADVDSFRKEMLPDEELQIWENIAGVYLAVIAEFELDQVHKKWLFSLLLEGTWRKWDLAEDASDWQRRAYEMYYFDGDRRPERFTAMVKA